MSLQHLLDASGRGRGTHPAIIEGSTGRTVSYATMVRLSDRMRDRLVALGVGRGARVGLFLRKSADGLASIFGILKAGAAYVPVDPGAPAVRNAYIHNNCDVSVVVVEKRFADAYREELAKLGPIPRLLVLEAVGGGDGLAAALDALDAEQPAPAADTADSAPDDLAYILYTSGSTGRPKGVMLSHRNALAFVDWCSATFAPRPSDVFSSHAPFHFDLSILDIYVSLKHGATLTLISEEIGKEPVGLANLIAIHGVTVWYSTPSILSLLVQFGRLGERDLSRLRLVLFAGEVFPIAQLRALQQQVPHPRYVNLYGPTETNVCTWYDVPGHTPDDRVEPYPIGITCPHLTSIVVDEHGAPVPAGTEGELCIAGDNVMQGYWGLPEQTAASFFPATDTGRPWYRTGDLVVREPDGNYRYVGRRDRMVKRRGYRVELGEIEACLHSHPSIHEAAVVAVADEAAGMVLKAHVSIARGPRPSIIELKGFCAARLPLYMIPDGFVFHESLPKTSTDKTDYQTLKGLR
jgi:L-proline---[L-prolyl-carrier protein] ligase